MMLWLVRVVWASLPITAGPAAAEALEDWSAPPRVVAEAMLWVAWTIVLVALFAPRPVGLTIARVISPSFVVLSVVVFATGAVGALESGVALAATLLAGCVTLAYPSVALACANGAAYGDERRFPLRVPPVLWVGLLPSAALLVAAGVAAGPLLLADARIGAGTAAVVVGLPLAAFAARSLHSLSRRWTVLVPAGLVLVDPLTLPDPVLFVRERIESLRIMQRAEPVPPGALDLRLGARGGSLAMTLDRPTEFLQTRRGRRGSVAVKTTDIHFAAIDAPGLLTAAGARRIRVSL